MMPNLVLVAPLAGWSAPLEEVPDPVFAGHLMGDGVAIDPTSAELLAPCDGEVLTIPSQRHAVTLRASNGAQILLHVGIDTVALDGAGFEAHVQAGARVKAGERLLSFDLDRLARHATSLLTPIIVTDEVPFSIVRRATNCTVAAGDFLLELAPVASRHASERGAATSREHTARMIVPLEHGLHARPAALVVSRIKAMSATVNVAVHGRSANARSPTALMALGVRKGDEVTLTAAGPDAAAALAALQDAIRDAAKDVGAHPDDVSRTAAAQLPVRKVAAQVPPGSMHGTAHARPASESNATEEPPATHAALVSGRSPESANSVAAASTLVRGVIASPGLAVGHAFHLVRREIHVPEAGAGEAHERQCLDAAIVWVRGRLQSAASAERGPGRDVLAAHLELLDDPELIANARDQIARDKSAGFAWRQVMRANIERLRALPDARMAERADDLLDLEWQVLEALMGASAAAHVLPERALVLADDLLPSQFVALDATRIAGICTAGGGPTSHVAILAAALDIPMVVAAGPRLRAARDGALLVLDADSGVLHTEPSPDEVRAAEREMGVRRQRHEAQRAAAHRECRTGDGVRIEVFANVGSVEDAAAGLAQGAEGCGLLRTEFLFLGREHAPDEATQSALYSRVIAALDGRPVVIRTLDVGGDKPLAYLPLPAEENPALGVRGVRVSLRYPDVLRTQLRAILRARPSGRCRILLPMVSDAAEVRAVGELLDEARGELGHEEPVPLGAMIETPAAAMVANQIAREADFLSIGTNDLTQYTLAIDRGNPALASRLDALHPAVLRLIAQTVRGARLNHRDVGVCGGLASDVVAAPILLGLGVNELSAVPAVIPRLKALIGTLDLRSCEVLAGEALQLPTAADVRARVNEWMSAPDRRKP